MSKNYKYNEEENYSKQNERKKNKKERDVKRKQDRMDKYLFIEENGGSVKEEE